MAATQSPLKILPLLTVAYWEQQHDLLEQALPTIQANIWQPNALQLMSVKTIHLKQAWTWAPPTWKFVNIARIRMSLTRKSVQRRLEWNLKSRRRILSPLLLNTG
jgi:hypothetical protein